ncbi:hypothetical protein BGZ80_011517 [Entomortierella chlamydospora]|uniref:Uncharacterized protein n=1 Tax=Entomortierella chlamydospora TaxID=101097 RepID=A0A9P6MTD7_9FUNG|nr:hypothetical protein BGZ80_011517 [Entomortierella chlamydospora]
MDNNNLDSVDRDGNTRAIASETAPSPLIGPDNNITCNHEPMNNRHEGITPTTATVVVETNTSLSAPIPNTISTAPNTDPNAVHSSDEIADTTANTILASKKTAQVLQEQISVITTSSSSPNLPPSAVPSTEAASNYPSPSPSSPSSPLLTVPAEEVIPTSTVVTDHKDEGESITANSSSPIKSCQTPVLIDAENDQDLDNASNEMEKDVPSRTNTPLSIETTGLTAQGSFLKTSQSLPRATVEDVPFLNARTPADSDAFLSSTSSTSSSSSLSEYLIIGQEQVEKEDSEYDRRSDHSSDFYGEQYGSFAAGEYSDASLDSQGEDVHFNPQQQEQHHHSQSRRRRNRHRTSFVEGSDNELYEFPEGYQDEDEHGPHSSQHRITETDTYESHRKKRDSVLSQAEASAPLLSLPTLKAPSIRGISKSVIEFVVVSAVCVTLMTCLFAFSYVSTGANHLLGWYSDQQIGQRIRDGIKEREHMVQEALEKMAGEEYAKVKRRSRQYQQQHQQTYGYGHGNPYQQKYQQQYRQEREQRQQQRQEKEGLSTAEWQDLIRAASISFMARFSKPTPPVRGARR